VEASPGEVGLGETKRRRGQRRSRKKIERAGKEEARREEDSRGKKSGRRMGNLK